MMPLRLDNLHILVAYTGAFVIAGNDGLEGLEHCCDHSYPFDCELFCSHFLVSVKLTFNDKEYIPGSKKLNVWFSSSHRL